LGIILPEIVESNRALEASLETLQRKRERAGWLTHFDDALKGFDSKLSLVKARETIALERGLIPGFWHIKRENGADLPDTYLPITGPSGEFMEPHQGVLDMLREKDLQRPGRMEELRAEWDEQDRRLKAQQDQWRAEMSDEFAQRYKSMASPGISFSDTPWTNSKRARR
jgi:hypothetical protein